MNIELIEKVYEVNEEQAKALDIDKNIALHAGAGSGKTRVLTRRFLRLLLEGGAKVDDIVAITFTKKQPLK
ncbi:UvrD-helicase domain-containing protein [Caloramator sp. mosi_1]|uniref:UvrD-helicase domain-containing protein n=1 Tax=Caloramator sp. mosi_1 TaxID=3023090 RepID=UPI00235E9D09|nr:UvrD-helicase domain-containing protein [Caloramator sp. mosi_1]WDC84787.1 UvrD-helicase domain-containing protein [Caloramator sp. mosi_1]